VIVASLTGWWHNWMPRDWLAFAATLIGGIAGLFLSFWWDLPSGAAIVCTFGALLILISFLGLWRRRAKL